MNIKISNSATSHESYSLPMYDEAGEFLYWRETKTTPFVEMWYEFLATDESNFPVVILRTL